MDHRSCAECGQQKERWASTAPVFVCCVCEDVELCLRCFVKQAEPGGHKRAHGYRIRSGREELLAPGWTAAEELSLLNAVGEKGLGNWVDAAVHVPRKKSVAEVEDHYWVEYAGRHGVVEPRRLRCAKTGQFQETEHFEDAEEVVKEQEATAAADEKEAVAEPPPLPEQIEEGGRRRRAKAVPCDTSFRNPPPPVVAPVARGRRCAPARFESTMTDLELSQSRVLLAGAELAGYTPLRGDFDVEHDNSAELLIADMEFREEDSTADRGLKVRVVQLYCARLDERERRKRFVIERGLLDSTWQRELESRLQPDERAMVAQARGFASYHTAEEHEVWVEGLLDSMRLRKKIKRLEDCQAMGMRTITEVHAYDEERAQVELQVKHHRRKNKEDLRYGNGATSEDKAYSHENRKRSVHARERRYNNRALLPPPPEKKQEGDVEMAEAPPDDDPLVEKEDDHAPLKKKKKPGAELLADKEMQLCDSLQLAPREYLGMKEALLSHALNAKQGSPQLSKREASQLLEVSRQVPDEKQVGEVYDFAVDAGWLSSLSDAECWKLKKKTTDVKQQDGDDEKPAAATTTVDS